MRRVVGLIALWCSLALALIPLAGAAGAAQVVVGAHDYPPTVCSTLSISTQNPRPGQSITISGINFKPDASVHLVLRSSSSGAAGFARPLASGDIGIGTATTDARGSFTIQVTLPSSITNNGSYLILATSGAVSGSGCPADPSQSLNLLGASASTSAAGSSGSGGTAFTGIDIAAMVAGALALIGIGAALTRRGRRPSTRH